MQRSIEDSFVERDRPIPPRVKPAVILTVCALLLAGDLFCLAALPYSQSSTVGRFLQVAIFGGRTHCYFGPTARVVRTSDGAFVVRPTWMLRNSEWNPATGKLILGDGMEVGNLTFICHDRRNGFYAPTRRSIEASVFGADWIPEATAQERSQIEVQFTHVVLMGGRYDRFGEEFKLKLSQVGEYHLHETLWTGYLHNALSIGLFVLVLRGTWRWATSCIPWHRWPKHCCSRCGYDIRGTMGSRCPECGLSPLVCRK